jgi:threonine dehydratase
MKLDAMHWLQVVLAGVSGAAIAVAHQFPQYSATALMVATGAGGFLASLGLVSRSVLPQGNTAATEPATMMATTVTSVKS